MVSKYTFLNAKTPFRRTPSDYPAAKVSSREWQCVPGWHSVDATTTQLMVLNTDKTCSYGHRCQCNMLILALARIDFSAALCCAARQVCHAMASRALIFVVALLALAALAHATNDRNIDWYKLNKDKQMCVSKCMGWDEPKPEPKPGPKPKTLKAWEQCGGAGRFN